MFNFLEYPRVVLELSKKMGPVRDVAFTTRQPEKGGERVFKKRRRGFLNTQPLLFEKMRIFRV